MWKFRIQEAGRKQIHAKSIINWEWLCSRIGQHKPIMHWKRQASWLVLHPAQGRTWLQCNLELGKLFPLTPYTAGSTSIGLLESVPVNLAFGSPVLMQPYLLLAGIWCFTAGLRHSPTGAPPAGPASGLDYCLRVFLIILLRLDVGLGLTFNIPSSDFNECIKRIYCIEYEHDSC